MNKFFLFSNIILLLASCQKDDESPGNSVPPPAMIYTNLQDAEIIFGGGKGLDIDGNGSVDFAFHTLYVGDALLKRDRKQYYITSGIGRNLLNDANDQSPVLNKGDKVMPTHPGYDWWQVSAILLAEKIIPEDAIEFWQGNWKNASRKYMPVQVLKDQKPYHGWIELSFDTNNEKLILHKAALCTLPDVEVRAGY